MPTNFQYRLIIIVPVAKVAAVVAWLQANIDPNTDANLGPPLNPSGLFADAITHRWCCGSFVDSDCKAILVKICQLAGVATPTPAQWDNATKAQRISWLVSVQAAILSGYGAWIDLAGNANTWNDPQAALGAMVLKVRAAS